MKIFKIILLLILSSCSIQYYERKAIRDEDRELYRAVDCYYETVNGKENNYKGEQDSIKTILKKQSEMDKEEIAEIIKWYWREIESKPYDVRAEEVAQMYLDDKNKVK